MPIVVWPAALFHGHPMNDEPVTEHAVRLGEIAADPI
jgi:hypothetical protein